MDNMKKSYIVNVYASSNVDISDLSRMSDQIKANIAVTLLKHRLKNYIMDAN